MVKNGEWFMIWKKMIVVYSQDYLTSGPEKPKDNLS
jgi:hypothetical protein